MSACSRGQCSFQSNPDNILNQAQYAYQTDRNATIRQDSLCIGNGGGLGVMCSKYGAARVTAAELGDPTLIQRSYMSSACPPSAITHMPDTQHSPAPGAGLGVTSFATRNFFLNTRDVTEKNMLPLNLFPNSGGAEGYKGLARIHTWIPSREISRCRVNAQASAAACAPLSAQSYGSYTVV